jgi:RimJ/RimL family protein N-acetyltransferase
MLRLARITGAPGEMAALQAVLEAAPRFFECTTGLPAGAAEAQSEVTALPPGKTYDDKFVWGLYADDAMIGCADVVRGWNTREKAIIGLLLLAEPWQGRGLGRAFAALVEDAVAAWPEITTLRLGVVATNHDAHAFWRRLGFRETGEVKTATPPFVADIVVLEKPLARGGA